MRGWSVFGPVGSRDELYSAQSTNLTNTITNYPPGYLSSESIHADHEKGNMALSTD